MDLADPASSGPVVAVVLAHDGFDTLPSVVDAVRRQTVPVAALVVVDNASTDGSRSWLTSLDGVAAVLEDRNLGVGAGHNRGWDEARRLVPDVAFIWALEHDTIPEPGCLARLLATAMATPERVGAIVPRQLRTAHEVPADAIVTRHRTLTFNGTLFAVAAVDEAGPVREDFVVGHEDREYAWRLISRDWIVLRDGGARVVHRNKGARHRGRPSVSRAYYSNRNEAYLLVRLRRDRLGLTRVLWRTAGGLARAAIRGDERAARMRARARATVDGLRGDLGWKQYPYLQKP